VILGEGLGYALAPVPFMSTAAAGLALQTAGSDDQQERWLSGIAGLRSVPASADSRPEIRGGR